MDAVIAGFVRGRIVISLIMGVLFAIGWEFCDVPWAIPLGLLVGLFSLVPYLGGVGLPVAIALLWFDQLGAPPQEQMSWYWIIAGPTIVFIAVQVIEGYILTPWIAGKATNLDPVSILAAVLAGGALLGVYGMLIAIPLVACIKILLTEVLMPRVKLWLAGHAADPLPIEGGG
jgi:predicted PurR-regulated permease PerM